MTTESKAITVAQTVKHMEPEFALLLKSSGTDPKKFMNNALLAISSKPEIQSGEVNRKSVFDVCSRAANDGVVLDGKEAALIIGWNEKLKQKEAQYRLMSGGIMQMIRRSPEIERVACQLVYENDDFVVDFVTDEVPLKHTLTPDALLKGRGQMVGVYFVAKLRNGEWTSPEVMSKDEVDAVRDGFAPKDKNGNFSKMWRDAYGEAARKTVLHRAAKRLPLGESASAAIEQDAVEDGTLDNGTIVDHNTGEITNAPEKPKRGRKAAEVVQAAAKAQDEAAEAPQQNYVEAEYEEQYDEETLPI